jgi:hypothetical protein
VSYPIKDVLISKRVLTRAHEQFFAHPRAEIRDRPGIDIVRGQFNVHGADLFTACFG